MSHTKPFLAQLHRTAVRIVITVSLVLAANANGVVFAQLANTNPLQTRLNDVCALLHGDDVKLENIFSPGFLAQVPPARLKAGMMPLVDQFGKCSSVEITKRTSEHSAEAEGLSDKGYVFPMTISIQPKAPYLIDGFFVKPPRKKASSFEDIITQLSALEGSTSFAVMDVESGEVIASKDTSEVLPTGSTFKLWVLGTLASSIDAKRNTWEKVVLLDSNNYSLPSGVTQSWPHGAPVTLHTLATQMISISDNTATDLLIKYVGKSAIEKQQQQMGNKNFERNIPFLTTREMFALKFSDKGKRAEEYVAATSVNKKRDLLTECNNSVALSDITFVDEPLLPNKVEWFSTTPDLCRTMQWFYKRVAEANFNKSSAHGASLGVLSVNPGLDVNATAFPYIGYKGGSESGVLNMTYLLQRQDERWFALSVSWMNTEEVVDLTAFSGIVSGAIKVLETY